MNDVIHGIYNKGGHVKADRSAFGVGATVNNEGGIRKKPKKRGIGVITVTSTETRSVVDALGLSPASDAFYTADSPRRVIATQAIEQGPGAAINAAAKLAARFVPDVLVLTGIGGGIDSRLRIGDVVVTTRVVCYDLHKETPGGIQRRGRDWHAPVAVDDAVNRYFADRGEPAEFGGFAVHPGIIGSGSAVIASAQAELRNYLKTYNDKILAVDMESDGLGHYCHQQKPAQNWVTIRGISDHADERKDDSGHAVAARNAALVLHDLIPYLVR